MKQQLADAPDIRDAVELSLQPRVDQPVTLRTEPAPARVVTPTDLLAIAYQSGDKDIERLERLMAMDIRYLEMQENDRKRDAQIAFEADFVGFKGENVIIPKTKPVDRGRGGSFSQAEFDEVCGRLAPALSKHGFGFRHKQRFGVQAIPLADGTTSQVPWVWVTCILSHKGGHADTLDLDGPADTQTVNSPIQNAQSAASYLKRQSLLAITGTATGGEDDENRPAAPKSGATEQHADDAGAAQKITLRNAGDAAARGGLQALTAWWAKLSPREQKDMSADFSAMRKAARLVDEGGAR